MIDEDETTPVDGTIWTMHPNAVRTEPKKDTVPLTGGEQRRLDEILNVVTNVLIESRTIREHAQTACDRVIAAVDEIPRLKARMNRVEMIAIGATIINIVMLFVASCVR